MTQKIVDFRQIDSQTRRTFFVRCLQTVGFLASLSGLLTVSSRGDEPQTLIGSWKVISIGNRKLQSSENIALVLNAKNEFYGKSTVNRYGGSYQAPNAGNCFSKIRSTKMAGLDDAMELESEWFKTLEQVNQIERIGTKLNFYREKELLASLEELTMVGKWLLSKLDGMDDNANFEKVSLEILEDGTFSGVAGVNLMNGQLSKDSKNYFQRIRTTRKAGPPELMKLENGLLTALSKVNRFESTGDALVLYEDDSLLVEFQQQAEQPK